MATYEDMINYLRHFAAPFRLQKLRDASEEERPAAWAAFVKETDAQPETPAHEELRLYFARLMRANARFREEATIVEFEYRHTRDRIHRREFRAAMLTRVEVVHQSRARADSSAARSRSGGRHHVPSVQLGWQQQRDHSRRDDERIGRVAEPAVRDARRC